MRNLKFMLSVLIAATLLGVSPAGAGMIGYTIEANAFYPSSTTPSVFGGPRSAVVGAGVEFLDGQFNPFFGPSFDFDDATITITHTPTGHSSGAFNGYRFTDQPGMMPDFTGFSVLSDNTGFFSGNPSRLFFDANNLWINFESLFFPSNANIVLSVTSGPTVPEPASLLLLGTGLIGAVRAVRRKRG